MRQVSRRFPPCPCMRMRGVVRCHISPVRHPSHVTEPLSCFGIPLDPCHRRDRDSDDSCCAFPLRISSRHSRRNDVGDRGDLHARRTLGSELFMVPCSGVVVLERCEFTTVRHHIGGEEHPRFRGGTHLLRWNHVERRRHHHNTDARATTT